MEDANKIIWHEIAGIKRQTDNIRKQLAAAYDDLSRKVRSLIGSRKAFTTEYMDFKKYKEDTVIIPLEARGLELKGEEEDLLLVIQKNNKIKRRYEADLKSIQT